MSELNNSGSRLDTAPAIGVCEDCGECLLWHVSSNPRRWRCRCGSDRVTPTEAAREPLTGTLPRVRGGLRLLKVSRRAQDSRHEDGEAARDSEDAPSA